MITRRGFLGALGALPFVSKWLPSGAAEPAVPGRGLYTLPDIAEEARIVVEGLEPSWSLEPGAWQLWGYHPPVIVELQTLDGPVELDLGELEP